jgi:ribosome maturation protein Sdo1
LMRQCQILSWARVASSFAKQANSSRAAIANIENSRWEEGNVSWIAVMAIIAAADPFSQHLDVCWAVSIRHSGEANLNT